MASIIKKEKINNCFKGIKSCIKSIKNADYEIVSYDKPSESNKQQTPEINRNLHHLKSRSTNNLQPEANHALKKQKAHLNLLDKFNLVSNQEPQFHSTQIEPFKESFHFDDDNSAYYSMFDFQSNKVSSTINKENKTSYLTADYSLINEEDTPSHFAFSNPTYVSPIIQRTSSFSSFKTASDEFSQYQLNLNKSDEFQSVNSNSYLQSLENELNNQASTNDDQLYVCVVPYEAKMQGDISLNYSDRIKLIHTINGMSLVQNVSTKQCGYVPYFCITLLAAFLNQI